MLCQLCRATNLKGFFPGCGDFLQLLLYSAAPEGTPDPTRLRKGVDPFPGLSYGSTEEFALAGFLSPELALGRQEAEGGI